MPNLTRLVCDIISFQHLAYIIPMVCIWCMGKQDSNWMFTVTWHWKCLMKQLA